ncbi:MAG: hypothetical protein AAGI24_17665 [Pseudomonadota bacterium]
MTYLLIFAVLLLALSPLLAMMPTRRQRELARLRQAAASAGLFVKLDRDGGEPGQVYYGCRRQRGDDPAQAATLLRSAEGWALQAGQWRADRTMLLSPLPEAVMRCHEDAREVGVYWGERGAVEDVQVIAQVLRKLLGRSW